MSVNIKSVSQQVGNPCTQPRFSLAVDVDDGVVERGAAGVWQTVLPLTLSMHRVVWAQGAGLGLFQAHQFHRSTLTP